MKWLTRMGVALKKLERAKTEDERKAALMFAWDMLMHEPVTG